MRAAVKVAAGPVRMAHEVEGVLVPAESAALSIEPAAYEGELRIEEVVPHGTRVREGDVLLRVRSERAEEMLRQARWTLRAAEVGLESQRRQLESHEEDSKEELARARKDAEDARAALKGHLEVNRPLEAEEFEQNRRSYVDSIEDQTDELEQLGKMYKEDKLTGETEEIVLKRARRQLESTRKRLELYLRRHEFSEAYQAPLTEQSLRRAVRDKERALRSVSRGQEGAATLAHIAVEKGESEVADAQRSVERLEADLEALTLRAPRDGWALHAALEPKVAVNILKAGQSVAPRTVLLTVAAHGLLKVRFTLEEADRYRLTAGLAARLQPAALPGLSLAGSLEPVSGFPLADNTWNAHILFGHEDDRLLPLLKCKASITLFESKSAIQVPEGVLFRREGETVCYVRGDAPFGVARRAVALGPRAGGSVVILEGLADGDEVLLQEPAR